MTILTTPDEATEIFGNYTFQEVLQVERFWNELMMQNDPQQFHLCLATLFFSGYISGIRAERQKNHIKHISMEESK